MTTTHLHFAPCRNCMHAWGWQTKLSFFKCPRLSSSFNMNSTNGRNICCYVQHFDARERCLSPKMVQLPCSQQNWQNIYTVVYWKFMALRTNQFLNLRDTPMMHGSEIKGYRYSRGWAPYLLLSCGNWWNCWFLTFSLLPNLSIPSCVWKCVYTYMFIYIHPRNSTWISKMTAFKRYLLSNTAIFRVSDWATKPSVIQIYSF